jgi:hypothetical protein
MRGLHMLILIAVALGLAGCRQPDVCAGQNGTCVALQVTASAGVTVVDQLAISVSGSLPSGTKRTPTTPLRLSFPINVAVSLPTGGSFVLDVVAYLGGKAIAHGATRVQVATGKHAMVSLPIAAGAPAIDMAVPLVDMTPPPTAPDLYVADRDMAGDGLQPGESCSVDAQCASHHCADGVCCLTACDDACHACNLPLSPGQCAAVGAGVMPRSGHPSCGPDPEASCMRDGYCDGSGSCRLWKSGTVCAPSLCQSNTYTGPARCDGLGACKTPASSSCAPYVCKDTTQCWGACTDNTQCQTPAVCHNTVTLGSCGLKTNGAQCQGGSDCLSGNCTDGVCCTSGDCGLCRACNLNGMGTCSPVGAGGSDPKNGCAMTDVSTCGTDGTCDGNGGCRLWVQGTVCQPYACVNNAPQHTECDGAGSCNQTITDPDCKPYACNGGVCYFSCSRTQLKPKFYCYVYPQYCASGCSCTVPDGGLCGYTCGGC